MINPPADRDVDRIRSIGFSSSGVRCGRGFRRWRHGAGDQVSDEHAPRLGLSGQDVRRVALFDDGSEVAADLLVAADGMRSTVRRQLQPAVEPRYAGYVAWRGLADMAELSGAARDLLRNRFAFCLPDREQALGYPVDGALGSAGRYNCVWYRPADPAQDLPRLLTGGDGRQYSGAIPPDRLHPDVLARMRADATSVLAPPFAEVMRKARQLLLQAIFDLETPRLIVGRCRHTSSSDNADVSYFNVIGTHRSFEKVHVI
jgi:hypothetical protein